MTTTEPTAPATDPLTWTEPEPVAAEAKRGPGRPRKHPRTGNGDTKPKPPSSAGGRSPGRPSNIDKLGEHLTAQFAGLGMIVFAFNPAVGQILVEDSESHGKALAALAEQSPKIRKVLEGTVSGSAWVGVAIAFGSTGMRVSAALREQGAAEAPAAEAANPFASFLAAEAPGGS